MHFLTFYIWHNIRNSEPRTLLFTLFIHPFASFITSRTCQKALKKPWYHFNRQQCNGGSRLSESKIQLSVWLFDFMGFGFHEGTTVFRKLAIFWKVSGFIFSTKKKSCSNWGFLDFEIYIIFQIIDLLGSKLGKRKKKRVIKFLTNGSILFDPWAYH